MGSLAQDGPEMRSTGFSFVKFCTPWALTLTLGLASTLTHLSDAQAFGGVLNKGHRVAAGRGEHNADLPENSIAALEAALLGRDGKEAIQLHRNFQYLESDVQETRDGQLVLFHDEDLERMFPNRAINHTAYRAIFDDPRVIWEVGFHASEPSELKVRDLSLEQLRTLVLADSRSERIARFEEFLERSAAWGLIKPVAVEVKDLYSDGARSRYVTFLADFRDQYVRQAPIRFESGYDLDPAGVTLFGFGGKISDAFGEPGTRMRERWCRIVKKAGFQKLYRPIFHSMDHCSEYSDALK